MKEKQRIKQDTAELVRKVLRHSSGANAVDEETVQRVAAKVEKAVPPYPMPKGSSPT